MQELNLVERVIALEQVELLKGLSPDQLAMVAHVARQVNFPPGRVIVSPDAPPKGLLVILDGSVELLQGSSVLEVARQNDVLGSWALFDDSPLALTARTIDDTVLLEIDREDFYDLLADHTEIASAIFSAIVRRFRSLLERAPAE